MSVRRPTLLGATALLALATVAPALAAAPAAPDGGVTLEPRGTYATGQFDESAAEIV